MIFCNEYDEFKIQSRSFCLEIFLQKLLEVIQCNKEDDTLKYYGLNVT